MRKLTLLLIALALLIVTVSCDGEFFSHSHRWVYSISKVATCTEGGEITKTCSVCSAVETEKVALLEHTPGAAKIVVKPSCIAKGKAEIYCTECGKLCSTIELDLTDHDKVTVQQTIDSKNYKEITYCSVCNANFGTVDYTLTCPGHIVTQAVTDPITGEERTKEMEEFCEGCEWVQK